jgi:hypothetical protein
MVGRTVEPGEEQLDVGLLSPSVAASAARPYYSSNATFLTAFFGGPLAAVFMQGLNARFLGRWQRERLWLGLAMLVAIVGIVLVSLPAIRPEVLPFMPEWLGQKSSARMASRALAVALWGALFLRMRPTYRAAELHTHSRPAWKDGILIVLASMGLQLVIVMLTATAVQP